MSDPNVSRLASRLEGLEQRATKQAKTARRRLQFTRVVALVLVVALGLYYVFIYRAISDVDASMAANAAQASAHGRPLADSVGLLPPPAELDPVIRGSPQHAPERRPTATLT